MGGRAAHTHRAERRDVRDHDGGHAARGRDPRRVTPRGALRPSGLTQERAGELGPTARRRARRSSPAPSYLAARRSSRRGVGQRTEVAQPSFSNTWITRAEMSTWPRSTPCRAQVGSAWCRLCHDSPKRHDRQRPDVARVVARGERRVADHVADRVDRPRDVVQQRNPHQARPEERGERAPPRPGQQAAEQRGHQQRGHRQQDERPVHAHDVAVGEQIGREALLVGLVAVEQPADVRVPEALAPARPGRCRTATASAGRPPCRRTRGGGGGRPPSRRPGPAWPGCPPPPARSAAAARP